MIPPPLHRLALGIAYRVRQRWRRFAGAPIAGVSVFVSDLDGKLLMVRHSYGPSGWLLPGGGMKRGETPEDAARREIREEVGCALEGVRVFEELAETIAGSPHAAYLVTGRTMDRPRADMREVVEARFFPVHSLPEPQTPLTRARIAAWRGANERR